MNILKQVNTPFDSSWNALQKVYWPKLNLTICSVTKSVKSSNRRRWWRAIRSIKINLPVSTWSSDLEPKRQIVEQVKTYRLQKNGFNPLKTSGLVRLENRGEWVEWRRWINDWNDLEGCCHLRNTKKSGREEEDATDIQFDELCSVEMNPTAGKGLFLFF